MVEAWLFPDVLPVAAGHGRLPVPEAAEETAGEGIMKLDFRLRGWKSNAQIRGFVEKQLERLPRIGPVSNAQVVLVRSRAETPAWTASAHLAVPGPDLKAEARDHTFEAAWRKVMDLLHDQIEERRERRRHRLDARQRLRPSGRTA